jgi:hypothetical protein
VTRHIALVDIAIDLPSLAFSIGTDAYEGNLHVVIMHVPNTMLLMGVFTTT